MVRPIVWLVAAAALLAAFVLTASVAVAAPLDREPAQATTLQVKKIKVKGWRDRTRPWLAVTVPYRTNAPEATITVRIKKTRRGPTLAEFSFTETPTPGGLSKAKGFWEPESGQWRKRFVLKATVQAGERTVTKHRKVRAPQPGMLTKPPPQPEEEPAPPPMPPDEPAGVGDSFTLPGIWDDTTVRVTLIEAVDPAPLTLTHYGIEDYTPDPGNRLVAFRFLIENLGYNNNADYVQFDPSYIVNPYAEVRVVDTSYQQYDEDDTFRFPPRLLGGKRWREWLLGGVHLGRAGDAISTGFMMFEIPKDATIRTVQYGGGADVAEWRLPPEWSYLKASSLPDPLQLGFGDSATLTMRPSFYSNRGSATVRVTLLEAVDPADPVASRTGVSPDPDGRLVAFRFLIENVGNVVYDNQFMGDLVQVVDASYWPYSPLSFAGPEPEIGHVTITPGDARSGFITFEIPRAATIRAVRFTTGGRGHEFAEWRLTP